jgi:hypothetical protein
MGLFIVFSVVLMDRCVIIFYHFYIVLKVYDGFLPVIHLQPTEIVSLHPALLWCMWNAEQPCWLCYSSTAAGWSRSKIFLDHVGRLFLRTYIQSKNAINTEGCKINHCENIHTYICVLINLIVMVLTVMQMTQI